MKKVIGLCFLCLIFVIGCGHSRKQPEQPATPKEVRDSRITVETSCVKGAVNKFLVTARYSGKLDMTWFMKADADLYLLNNKGKPTLIRAREPGGSRFHSSEKYFGNPQSNDRLTETLVLDTKGLATGRYRVVPSVIIFEYGKDAHEKMKTDPYYAGESGIRPGKTMDIEFMYQSSK